MLLTKGLVIGKCSKSWLRVSIVEVWHTGTSWSRESRSHLNDPIRISRHREPGSLSSKISIIVFIKRTTPTITISVIALVLVLNISTRVPITTGELVM